MMSIATIGSTYRRYRWRLLDYGRGLGEGAIDEQDAYCARCGASAGPGSVTGRGCAWCADKPLTWHRITRLGAYAPPMDEAVKQMKFARDWARRHGLVGNWRRRSTRRPIHKRPSFALFRCTDFANGHAVITRRS